MRCSRTGRARPLSVKYGSIDWLCWPMFDSSPCFTALIGGHAQVCHLQRGRDEARELFESVLALRNDVSLLAEEY